MKQKQNLHYTEQSFLSATGTKKPPTNLSNSRQQQTLHNYITYLLYKVNIKVKSFYRVKTYVDCTTFVPLTKLNYMSGPHRRRKLGRQIIGEQSWSGLVSEILISSR